MINGDEFRPYHQHFDAIYAQYGKDFSKYTGEFAGKIVEKVRDEAIKQGFNIVIEGTFRRAELPLKELKNVASVVEESNLSFFEIYSRETKLFDLKIDIKEMINKILTNKI